MNERRLWKVDSMLLREAINNIFAPCSSYYDIRKEVIRKMAIDYKEEWKKFRAKYGYNYIQAKEGSPKSTLTLDNLMKTWIRNAILGRERLMEEYVKENITTNINGGERHFHKVDVIDKRHGRTDWLIGTIHVHKADFDAWCKKKGGGK